MGKYKPEISNGGLEGLEMRRLEEAGEVFTVLVGLTTARYWASGRRSITRIM